MKKTFYFLMTFIGLALTSCEPMEDIHDEIDRELELERPAGTVEYTLGEDDYEALGLQYPNFNSEEDARALLPAYLSEIYPNYGANSSANITFDIYAPLRVEEYTMAASDYEAIGLDVNYFSGISGIQDFLEYKFPQADQGSYVELTYRTLADEIPYSISNDNFDLIGEELGDTYPDPASSAANYNNFDRREGNDAYWSNEMILEAINVVLTNTFDGVEGQKYNVTYAIYDGSAGTESMTVLFDGNSYVSVGGTAVELSNADFDLIGEELGETYPDAAESASNYNNFDRREGRDAYWSEEMILEALNVVLEENYPSATEGDQFEVSYAIYNGSAGTEIMSVIRSGDEYVIDESASVSTIEVTNVFALTNGSWNPPFTLDSEDYTEMGQTYPNFDDEEEAIYKLSIFLGREFPYAEEGDFIAVAYDFYDGGTSTEYANFVFEDGEWNHIGSVIQQTIQFGNTGTVWEPDNTIRYTLSGADYNIIAAELPETPEYEGPVSSMANYGNFDRRSGNSAYWSDEMILEAMRVLLNEIAPNAEVGQKYVITYDVYNGSNVTETINLIKDESGEWVINE